MAVCGRLRRDATRHLRGNDGLLLWLGKPVRGCSRVSGLSAVALVVAACLSLALPAAAATASTAPRSAPAVKVATAATSGSDAYFDGDSCTSRAFCMAVGGYGTSANNQPALSEMLTGGNWVAEAVPRPSAGGNIFANEVSCASAVGCLFVGSHWAGKRGLSANLAEAWNGSSWRIVGTTGPGGTSYSYLDDVACPTTKFCLAIGAAGTGRKYHDTAYIWENGATWRRIYVPSPSGVRNSELAGLACFSSKNCMAVGNYTSASGRFLPFAAGWHDGRWKLETTPSVPKQRYAEFQGVSCPTATRCMAVGETKDNTRAGYIHAFAETWSGGKWHVSTLRHPPSFFSGVSCPARNRCFAAGITFPSAHASEHPLIETWNGRTWKTQPPARTSAPNTLSGLEHVSCVSPRDCEVVGFSYDSRVSTSALTLAEKWNGQRWTVQTTPNP